MIAPIDVVEVRPKGRLESDEHRVGRVRTVRLQIPHNRGTLLGTSDTALLNVRRSFDGWIGFIQPWRGGIPSKLAASSPSWILGDRKGRGTGREPGND